jgi:hypothetical protein
VDGVLPELQAVCWATPTPDFGDNDDDDDDDDDDADNENNDDGGEDDDAEDEEDEVPLCAVCSAVGTFVFSAVAGPPPRRQPALKLVGSIPEAAAHPCDGSVRAAWVGRGSFFWANGSANGSLWACHVLPSGVVGGRVASGDPRCAVSHGAGAGKEHLRISLLAVQSHPQRLPSGGVDVLTLVAGAVALIPTDQQHCMIGQQGTKRPSGGASGRIHALDLSAAHVLHMIVATACSAHGPGGVGPSEALSEAAVTAAAAYVARLESADDRAAGTAFLLKHFGGAATLRLRLQG